MYEIKLTTNHSRQGKAGAHSPLGMCWDTPRPFWKQLPEYTLSGPRRTEHGAREYAQSESRHRKRRELVLDGRLRKPLCSETPSRPQTVNESLWGTRMVSGAYGLSGQAPEGRGTASVWPPHCLSVHNGHQRRARDME